MSVAFEQTLRSLSRDTRRGNVVMLGAGGLLLLAWFLLATMLPLPLVLESVDGRMVSTSEPTRIVASTDERIDTIAVRLGDQVRQHDPLIRFDQRAVNLQLESKMQTLDKHERHRINLREELVFLEEEHGGRLEVLNRSLDRIGARVSEVAASIDYSEVAVRIYEDLRSDRQIDELKLREASAGLEQNRQRLRALQIEGEEIKARIRATEQEWRATIASYERIDSDVAGQIAELRPQLEQLRDEIEQLQIRAPHDGVVEGIASVSVGQTVAVNTWLMTLSPAGDYQFEAKFLATDAAGRIKPGATSRISFSALPWTEYGTLAASVARVGNEELSGLITVQLHVDQEADLIALVGHGLTGQAVIEVDRVTLFQRLLRLLTRIDR